MDKTCHEPKKQERKIRNAMPIAESKTEREREMEREEERSQIERYSKLDSSHPSKASKTAIPPSKSQSPDFPLKSGNA